VLRRTVRAMLASGVVDRVQVVIHEGDRRAYAAAVAGLDLDPPIIGGKTRAASVRLGLEGLAAAPEDKVLIHDAARPFASPELIRAVVEALNGAEAACPALPVVDTLRRADGEVVPRERLTRAQTPQGFRHGAILGAHRRASGEETDDIAVARAAGMGVTLTMGDEDNFKITEPADFRRAERLLAGRCAVRDVRTGTGYDVHAFGPGDRVTLCGVTIPHDKELIGHSDADVGLHAITDAIFGALAEGDIGQWFPPSEPEWKGAASHIFLDKARERVEARGGEIANVDVTLICELPKIGPHAEQMRAAVAEILRIDAGQVSVKATTSERLGFTGREEGIAAQASATIVFRGDA
jgi:2-C-methyl-D-erythritol 4-phosphate cytidylyltransferase/2-C-methyl-D-erythritol 2,4-cyclodiphosphate synthase